MHIHTCISPCADMTMTPNNVVNMAYLKGLDAIAVSDHNTAGNLLACKAVAQQRGLVFVPALEVETAEEVHVLCYFAEVEQALEMGELVYAHLPPIENVPGVFGEQIAMNELDEPIRTETKLLIQSTTMSIDEVVAACRRLGGVPVPAHVNRPSNSIIASLGFIPGQLELTAVEVYRKLPADMNALEGYHVLYSSDAHYLEDILERESFITALDRSAAGILAHIADKK